MPESTDGYSGNTERPLTERIRETASDRDDTGNTPAVDPKVTETNTGPRPVRVLRGKSLSNRRRRRLRLLSTARVK